MDEKTQKQIELMTSCSYDDWDINQHFCWKVSCNECKLGKPRNPDGSEFTYGECREYAKKKADELNSGTVMTIHETNTAFEQKYNYRTAEKCCLNCHWGEPEYEGEATCCHPEREVPVEGNPGEVYIDRHNTCECNVCDAWKPKEKQNGK